MENEIHTTVQLRLPKILMDEFDRYAKEKGHQTRKHAFIELIEKELSSQN